MLATRLLLVGDDEVVRMTLAGVLEQSGFAITSAANAPEFLRPVNAKESSDVLLSDLHSRYSRVEAGPSLTHERQLIQSHAFV